jgi:hypothetical protein
VNQIDPLISAVQSWMMNDPLKSSVTTFLIFPIILTYVSGQRKMTEKQAVRHFYPKKILILSNKDD